MNCNKKFKILVTEAVGELGLEILRGAPDVALIEKVGISKDEIKRELADVNGIELAFVNIFIVDFLLLQEAAF